MAQVSFTPRSYFNAAQEQLGLAARLEQQGEHFAAHFFAGLAVESILRALSTNEGDSFDSSHSIQYWAGKADLLPKGTEERRDELRAKITELNIRWRANQRYYTEKMLDTYLHDNRNKTDVKVRGDRVKVSSVRMLELADDVVKLGVIRWNKKS